VIRPTVKVLPRSRLLIKSFGRNSRRAASARTRSRVSGRRRPRSLSAFEAVPTETPAARATSRMVGGSVRERGDSSFVGNEDPLPVERHSVAGRRSSRATPIEVLTPIKTMRSMQEVRKTSFSNLRTGPVSGSVLGGAFITTSMWGGCSRSPRSVRQPQIAFSTLASACSPRESVHGAQQA
jgi:hypothetical protein